MKPELYSEKAQKALAAARLASERLAQGYIGSEHILIGLAEKEGAARKALSCCGVSADDITDLAASYVQPTGRKQFTDSSGFTSDASHILEFALYEAKSAARPLIGTDHILLSILREDCFALDILKMLRTDISALKKAVSELSDDESASAENDLKEEENASETNTVQQNRMRVYSREGIPASRGENGSSDKTDDFCVDLTAEAAKKGFDPLIGCENELNRLIQTLLRRGKNNPVLIGRPGVGKSAIVEGLASLIAEGRITPELRKTRILRLDIASLVAGTKYRGDFEDRLKELLALADRDTILFIDEVHMIVGAGASEGGVDAANILKPALARGDVRVIGATTFDEYRKYIESDAALERRFSPITVEEPDRDTAIMILKGISERYEKHHGVRFTDAALASCVDMSIRCMPERCLPDKAIDIMDETAAHVRLHMNDGSGGKADAELAELRNKIEDSLEKGDYETASSLRAEEKKLSAQERGIIPTVRPQDVIRTAHELTGIPPEVLSESFEARALTLESALNNEILGNNEAVSLIASAVKSGAAGLSDPAKPIAALIIGGSRGTGKTYLGEALAKALYGDSNALLRFDMNDYSEPASVSTLLGSPLGYRDSDEGGRLPEAVRRKPFGVVMFDNMERACPEILTEISKILKDGVIRDGRGRTVSFRNNVLLITAGTEKTNSRTAGFAAGSDEADSLKAIMRALPSEMTSLADCTAALSALTRETVVVIAKRELEELASRVARRGIVIRFGASYASSLVDRITPENLAANGAWAIKRAVSEFAENTVTEMILNGRLKPEGEYLLDPNNDLALKP